MGQVGVIFCAERPNRYIIRAVDVVSRAGILRTIWGFQTHRTPIGLGTTECAKLVTNDFLSFAPVLEGFVIFQNNPGWETQDLMEL